MPSRIVALLAAVLVISVVPAVATADVAVAEADDAVVIAVVDSGFSPYHENFLAELMPQHLDNDPGNDLPLQADPASWLPGYSTASAASYGPINLTLGDYDTPIETLEQRDQAHSQIPQSSSGEVHLRYIPGTKIVGAVTFGSASSFFGSNGSHGNGTSSVSAGSIHGSCPECLVVLIRYGSGADAEAANDWAYDQPWIDVVTNSFGFSTVMRDRIYDGANTELQREASERGQTIFFSAGNGQANTFTAPNTTIQSSQEGPDWIVTVGGTSPSGGNYTGAGKPADIASIGNGYPSGSGGTHIDGTGTFGGTSNATPVVAGMYARTLWSARKGMAGASRTQSDGTVATGGFDCGTVVTDCALSDGMLTASELRTALFHAAVRTPQGLSPGGFVNLPQVEEGDLAAEGHGTLHARNRFDDDNWREELDRILGPLAGTRAPLQRSADERDWMVVDSWCRQQVHGSWSGGYYLEGETSLPAPSPLWPLRTFIQTACPTVFGALKDAGTAAAPAPESPLATPED